MKKIMNLIFLVLVVMTLALTSCSNEDMAGQVTKALTTTNPVPVNLVTKQDVLDMLNACPPDRDFMELSEYTTCNEYCTNLGKTCIEANVLYVFSANELSVGEDISEVYSYTIPCTEPKDQIEQEKDNLDDFAGAVNSGAVVQCRCCSP